jgi:hypothetical protein
MFLLPWLFTIAADSNLSKSSLAEMLPSCHVLEKGSRMGAEWAWPWRGDGRGGGRGYRNPKLDLS